MKVWGGRYDRRRGSSGHFSDDGGLGEARFKDHLSHSRYIDVTPSQLKVYLGCNIQEDDATGA